MKPLIPSPNTLEEDRDPMAPFFDAFLTSHPFIDNRVNGLTADGVDVDDIHHREFEQLTSLALKARDLKRGIGAMLWGEAGIGKSHLLSRLERWAAKDGHAVAVYLHNLQASPENLPRSLLKSVVSILTGGRTRGFFGTPLSRLTQAMLREAVDDATGSLRWTFIHREYELLLDRMSAADPSHAALMNRTVYEIAYTFFYSAAHARKPGGEQNAALAVRWLSGDALEPAEAQRIGLPPGRNPEEPAALADDQQIKQVLVALSRMALSQKKPLILCFDQVDNLADDQAAALSRFLEALIDSAPNLLVVTAGIQATLVRWRATKVIQDSAWDRLAQFEVPLQRLSPQESRRILGARLEKVVAPFEDLEWVQQRLHQDELFPLGSAWAEEFFQRRIDWRPRDVINGAREAWRVEQEALRRQGGLAWLGDWPHSNGPPAPEWTAEQIQAAIDHKVEQKIAEHCDEVRRRPETLPPDAANLAGLIERLVQQAGAQEIGKAPTGKPNSQFPYNFIVRQSDGESVEKRTGVLVLGGAIARSTTAALSWLLHGNGLAERVLLVTEERRPLAFGKQPDATGRAHYVELRRRESSVFQHIELSVDQYIQLNALQAVVGMAGSGDLEIELPGGMTRTVSAQEAIESHRRRGRYREAPVLRETLAAAPQEGAGAGQTLAPPGTSV